MEDYLKIEWSSFPKTDWTPSDKFNYQDLNRITANIRILFDYASRVFNVGMLENMEDKDSYRDLIYADDLNAVKRNISMMNDATIHAVLSSKTYTSNGRPWNNEDLNQIEGFMVDLADESYYRLKMLHRLPLRLTTTKYYV